MSVTSTTAPTRLALNTWQSRRILIGDDGVGTVTLDLKDSGGAVTSTVTINVKSGTADKLVYLANGSIDLVSNGVTSAGIGAALLTALSSGTLAQRFQAVDDLLHTRTVIPT